MPVASLTGFRDVLAPEVRLWQRIEHASREVLERAGFEEIRTPLLESTDLFRRTIGEATDIVEKEMYTFQDRDGDWVTLRPEGTASVVRAFVEGNLHARDPVAKFYYLGAMFRHERPQKGRFRQFHQVGAELVGAAEPTADVDTIATLWEILLESGWRSVSVEVAPGRDGTLRETVTEEGVPGLSLEINSLGCKVCRPAYAEKLVAFLREHREALCADCRRRMDRNPLRTFDCKVEADRAVMARAPRMVDHLCAECRAHFEGVREGLDRVAVPFRLNPAMARGLDYYVRTAFEVVARGLGAQNAVAAGGRYDGLVRDLGGPDLPGVGFALGVERLALLLAKIEGAPEEGPDVYLVALGEEARRRGIAWALDLRRRGLRVEIDYGEKSMRSQMRRADKLGARFALIVGSDEIAKGSATLRDLGEKSQVEIALPTLVEEVARRGRP